MSHILYKRGDIIGEKYEVHGVLGAGGFGVVYLVYDHDSQTVYALKTFRDEFLHDGRTRELFRREAGIWVNLERHPYLVRAYLVDERGGRLYIAMEYIAPGEEGPNSLELQLRQEPPDLPQSLRWSIQFCHGMEYAYSKGVRCHRDIKPANIMIGRDRLIKITDFGLAGVLTGSTLTGEAASKTGDTMVGLPNGTMESGIYGTSTYMAPEQFVNAGACDERSDVYSFGVVLYQMASHGKLPFLAPWPRDDSEGEIVRFWRETRRLHTEAPVPKVNSLLFPVVEHCLKKEPSMRYQSFGELRSDLEPLLKRVTGEEVTPPPPTELRAWEWSNKGMSLGSLGRHEEAIRCYDRALEFDPQYAHALTNKGTSLHCLGLFEEAIRCYDHALQFDPRDSYAWIDKGATLIVLGRYEEAVNCCDRALELNPRSAGTWSNKGGCFTNLSRYEEAAECYKRALEIDPLCEGAWGNKGTNLHSLGRYEEAIDCYDRALELDPRSTSTWINKGDSLDSLGRYEEAIDCYDRALELDPGSTYAWRSKGDSLDSLGRYEEARASYDRALELDPRSVVAWINRSICLYNLGRYEEAIESCDRALEFDPQRTNAWVNKGMNLAVLGRFREAIDCYDRALKLDPGRVTVWYRRALATEKLGRKEEAVHAYKQFVALAPERYAAEIQQARQRIEELEEK